MTPFRRFMLAVTFVLMYQIVSPLYAQSSPTETPVPTAYTIEVTHIEGALIKSSHDTKNSDIGKVTPVQGIFNDCENDASLNCNVSDLLSGDSSVVQRWCERPENQSLCSSSGLTASTGWNLGLEAVREGDTLSAGDEIYTGDESGVVLQIGSDKSTIGSATTGAGAGKIVLSQHSALNIETLSGTADVPDIHLRLDTGLLATMPGARLSPAATFEIALSDASPGDTQQSSDMRLHRPLVIVKVTDNALPAVIVGHDPASGDLVVSVLDGTAAFIAGGTQNEISPGYLFTVKQKIQDKEGIPPSAPMTDQDWAVWVSALHFGGSDPSSFPILAHHVTDGEPEPFPVYALVHSTDGHAHTGDPHFDVSHTAHTQLHDTHTPADQATQEVHASPTDHHDTGTSHTDTGTGSHDTGSHDTGSHDTGTHDTGSHDTGTHDSGAPATEQPHHP